MPNNSEFDDDRTIVKANISIDILANGTFVDGYKITRLIGQGGFGIVYCAYDSTLDREIALKEYMPKGFAKRQEGLTVSKSEQDREIFELGLRSFINEAKLLAKFDHPYLVKVHRFFEANGTAYMVMPLYKGDTLKNIRNHLKDPPEEKWIKNLLNHLLDALSVLHDENCLHRDIAPDNIIILEDQKPLLLDFGAARRVIQNESRALTTIYKEGYAPIEQYSEAEIHHSQKQGAWTDIYALAATMYFTITGKKPAQATSRAVFDVLEPLCKNKQIQNKYSHSFLKAIDKALSFKPIDRPQSTQEFRSMLGLDTGFCKNSKDSNHSKALTYSLLAVIIAVIGIGGALFFSNEPSHNTAHVIEENFKEAEDCWDVFNYECVIAKTEVILDLDPEHDRALELLKIAQINDTEIDKNLLEAEECLDANQFECVAIKTDRVFELDKNNLSAQSIMQNAQMKRTHLQNIADKGEALDCSSNSNKDCTVKASLSNTSSEMKKPPQEFAQNLVNQEKEVDNKLLEAKVCLKNQNLECVLKKSEDILNISPNNNSAKTLKERARKGLAQHKIIVKNLREAEACLKNIQYSCALSKAKMVLNIAPDNKQAENIISLAKAEQKKAWEESTIE